MSAIDFLDRLVFSKKALFTNIAMKFRNFKKTKLMKKILKSVKQLILFEFLFEYNYIRSQFSTSHGNYQKHFPHWSPAATRKKIIANYWFNQVQFHLAVLGIAVIAALPFANWHWPLQSVFFAGLVSFIILGAVTYWPTFYWDFLPKLDTVMAEQERQTGLIVEISKCKRTQYLAPSLVVIYYVWSKAAKIPLLPANDQSGELLNNLYGVSNDKLKDNLSRLCKISSLSPKERAEIQKGINTARIFFEAHDFPPAQIILDQLEQKLRRA